MDVSVSRIRAHSDMYEMDLLLDINSDLYPIVVRRLVLALPIMLNVFQLQGQPT